MFCVLVALAGVLFLFFSVLFSSVPCQCWSYVLRSGVFIFISGSPLFQRYTSLCEVLFFRRFGVWIGFVVRFRVRMRFSALILVPLLFPSPFRSSCVFWLFSSVFLFYSHSFSLYSERPFCLYATPYVHSYKLGCLSPFSAQSHISTNPY